MNAGRRLSRGQIERESQAEVVIEALGFPEPGTRGHYLRPASDMSQLNPWVSPRSAALDRFFTALWPGPLAPELD
jgi:hypothetical protein